MGIQAWHGRTLADHISLRDTFEPQGFRFISLSVYGSTSSPYYAAVMIQPSVLVTQHDYPSVPANQFQAVFNSEAAAGFGPIIIAATGPASNPLFAAVFEHQPTIPFTRTGLGVNGDGGDPNNTIQAVNAQARKQGLILRWVASYGDASRQAFAALWVPNPSDLMWANDGILNNYDGVLDSSAGYQAHFDAQMSAGNRLAFVTLNTSGQYLGVFTDAQLAGAWYAHHGMTPAQYQTEFNTANAKGYYPACVQAAGPDANSATFAAIFANTQNLAPRVFTATGPVANAAIDNSIQQAMAAFNVRHGALAIVHGAKLVYARGYTWAESGFPIAQPTTCFRLASVSKVPTALAIYQLIQAGQLALSTKLNDVLHLQTPTGQQPGAQFTAITIANLLEHKSGLNPGGADNGVAVRDAWIAAGQAATLPVTAEQTDAYIASLPLVTAPGATQAYNNCGYYFLARVVAKLRGQSRPIDAFQQALFSPLGITRIRRAVSLAAGQPPDEARYQEGRIPSTPAWFDLLLNQSQMTPAQPLVPDQFGAGHLEIMEGSGGLSGAATDVARLVAILLWRRDNPAMTRKTLESMLSAGAALTAAGQPRAGYGFDSLVNLGSSLKAVQFQGNKGGWLGGTSTVVNFGMGSDNEWGFTLLWAGSAPGSSAAPAAPPGVNWYGGTPFMDLAEKQLGAADLFPKFGMASL